MTDPPRVDAGALRQLPKAELHLHLDGSLRPQTAVELASEIGLAITLDEARRRLIAPRRCRDQAELLTYFDLPIALLQSEAALVRAARELVVELADDGVAYAEIRWAPRLHLAGGLGVRDVIGAVTDGVAGAAALLGPRAPLVFLIVTAMRTHAPSDNLALADAAAAFGPPIVGFDLAGPEAGNPATNHRLAVAHAAAHGLALTCHAGEVPGSAGIEEALALGVRRVAHGVTAAGDERLMNRLRELDVTLDLCPTSNVQAGIVGSLSEHPVAALHRAGISVTLSTDDRTVSNTTLSA